MHAIHCKTGVVEWAESPVEDRHRHRMRQGRKPDTFSWFISYSFVIFR